MINSLLDLLLWESPKGSDLWKFQSMGCTWWNLWLLRRRHDKQLGNKKYSMGIRRTPVNSNPRGGYIHGRSKCVKGNGYVSKCCSNNGSKTIEENICHSSVPM